jgi:CheY-like chemotaxis protein
MPTTAQFQPRYRLLIADDDDAARETLRDVFEPAGFETLLASNGEEAVELVRQHGDIHLGLFDFHMPKLTGLEALVMVREFRTPLPTILLTADRDDQIMRQALSAEVFCVVAKPIKKNVLIYVVGRALSKFYSPPRPHVGPID